MNIDRTTLIKKSGLKIRLVTWWNGLKVKGVLGHLGLLLTLMVYTTAGGLVFRALESPAEIERVKNLNNSLHIYRRHLVATVINSQNRDVFNLSLLVNAALGQYEKALKEAYSERVQFVIEEKKNETSEDHQDLGFSTGMVPDLQARDDDWSLMKAVFFSSTVLTTIGYGNMVPRTHEGRIFCMLFALVGIPLTLTVIADWGRMFASTVSSLVKYLPPLPKACRPENVTGRNSLYALGSVCFLFLYLAAGAGLFVIWEDDWTFLEGFYFCFVTMTTIGFGDLVPKKPDYMLFCTLYILLGLALTSTIIELVRRQYTSSWRRLQALSGPLAETLRRIGDAAGGGIAADVSALQHDLRKVLTVVSMPRWHMGGGSGAGAISSGEDKHVKHKEWEEAVEAVIRDITKREAKKQPPPLVQIVIYESSV